MKLYVKASSDIGYLYILKHGTGPGTVPRDVVFLKERDLPNGYAAVWLDRFLTSGELRAYDIAGENDINRYLDRVGYCQKYGDVVPCHRFEVIIKRYGKPAEEEVVTAEDEQDLEDKLNNDSYIDWWDYNSGQTYDPWETVHENDVGNDDDDDDDDDVEACDTVTSAIMLDDEDSEHIASQVENDLKITCRDDGNWIYIFSDEDGAKSPSSYTDLNSYYTKLIKNKEYNRFKPVKKSIQYFEDKITELTNTSNSDEEFKDNYRNFLINFLGLPSVEACDKVTASSSPLKLFKILDLSTKAVSDMNAESSRRALERFLECDVIPVSTIEEADYAVYPYNHPEMARYYIKKDIIESCDKVTASTHRYSAGRIEDDGTEDFYYDTGFDSYDEAFDWGINHDCTHIYDRETDEFVPIESCDTKYFANMVSASNDPELDDDFLIEGYYDNQRRGLAESAETSDVSALNELANEYANKGYYIVVHNLTDGVITEFSADNWFNDIAPDGGAGLFMS